MRLYEGMRPLQVEIDQLRVTCKSQEEELKTMSSELLELQKVNVATKVPLFI